MAGGGTASQGEELVLARRPQSGVWERGVTKHQQLASTRLVENRFALGDLLVVELVG